MLPITAAHYITDMHMHKREKKITTVLINHARNLRLIEATIPRQFLVSASKPNPDKFFWFVLVRSRAFFP